MGNVRPPTNKDAQDPLLKYGMRPKRTFSRVLRCCVVTKIVILSLLLLVFLILFVGLPFAFKHSTELQRNLIFPTCDLWPADAEFTNFKKYNIEGVRNFYVNISETNVTLGMWHVLPLAIVNESLEEDFNYSAALSRSDFPVILHFHGNGGNRVADVDMYAVLRLFFHILAFDYRGYADSSSVKPSEEGIVEDSIQLYKWLKMQTDADIYFWGHSLGAALSTHTVAKLRQEGIVPTGLFLEAPFTTLREEIKQIPLTKLYETARTMRDPTQGKVTFHLLPADLHCDHMQIYSAPDLPNFIRDHVEICKEYSKGRG